MKKFLLFPLFQILFLLSAKAQDDTLTQALALTFGGFVDTYYGFDFNKPDNHTRPGFLYNHNRHNEFNINLAILQARLAGARYRANVALMAGTYAEYNLAAEQDLLQHVFEANAGVALVPGSKLWLDAGIFASHIGFEGAISSDNWTLTRSILAENTPYYLAGAKLTYSPNSQLTLVGLVCNGWQRIRRVDGNSTPAFGTQVAWTNGNVSLNWSTFVGSDDPDSLRRMRYFNNFYGKFLLGEKVGLIAGFDVGFQQKAKGKSAYNVWYSPVAIARFALNDRWALGLRGEYYVDENGVIIGTGTENGFKTLGFSANLDYAPLQNVLCRVEFRHLNSEDDIFFKEGDLTGGNSFLVGSIAVKIP